MSGEDSRRFTDQEVALVLRKAAEIEEAEGTGPGRGLSLADLREIAAEVGISPDAIDRAVAGLEERTERTPLLTHAPLVHRAVHAVQGELNDEALARLLRLVDMRTDDTGAISEALGTVQWTASDRFRSTQVSIRPDGGETTIQVAEKSVPRFRRLVHLLPTAWGTIIAGGVAAGLSGPADAAPIILGMGAGVGLLLGRLAWGWMSGRSEARVQRLAADLSREAYEAARSGLVVDRDQEES